MSRISITNSGAVNDFVRIEFGTGDCRTIERYEVRQQFMTKPDAFSITVGSGDSLAALIERLPPRTEYKLYIGDVLQQTGRTDGYITGESGGASTLTIRGRDKLAPMLDTKIEAERSFGSMTFAQFTAECIRAAGITAFDLQPSNEANRQRLAGVPVVTRLVDNPSAETRKRFEELKAEREAELAAGISPFFPINPVEKPVAIRRGITVESAPTMPLKVTSGGGDAQKAKEIKAKIGGSWYSFFAEQAALRGLFLFAGAGEQTFILAGPNVKQAPTARIVIERGKQRNAVSATTVRHRNETTGRHTRYVVYGRGGGKKAGRTKVRGEYVDEEMRALGFPDSQVWVEESTDAKTDAQALFLARRKCAEARRAGWEYVVPVQGHSTPSLIRPQERAVWTIDTLVEVLDYERNIFGNFWVSDVAFKRDQQGTSTDISLVRTSDLVFGEPEYQ